MTSKLTLKVNIEETVEHLGEVTVDETDLKAWMAETERPELTIQALAEYLADRNLEMAEKFTNTKNSTWSGLAYEDPTVTDIPIAAEPADPTTNDGPRYYWDNVTEFDEHQPYGIHTARIIDQEAGGVIAYTHEDHAPTMIDALMAAAATTAAA